MLQDLIINGLTIPLDQVARFAPIVTFHPSESFLPCSIDYLLAKARLVNQSGDLVKVGLSQGDLANPAFANGAFDVKIDPSCFAGQPLVNNAVDAPMYVSVQVPDNRSFVDLNFIFLFGYNGSQTARVKVPGLDFNCALPQYGEHQGDIEGITVRVKPDFSEIIFVRYEAHGNSTFYYPGEVDFEGTHPIVRCALNSHATYNGRGKNNNDWIVLSSNTGAGTGVDFIDIITTTGPQWRPFVSDAVGRAFFNGKLVFVGLDSAQNPIGDQVWVRFPGRLGSVQQNAFTSAVGIGGPLTDNQRNYTNTIAQLAQGAVSDDDKVGHGPSGLAGRPFIPATKPTWNPLLAQAVATGRTNNLEVFAVGPDGTLYHNWCSNGWNGWQPNFLGAPKVSSVTTGNTGNLEVFAVGLDGTLYHNWCSSDGWNDWQPNFMGAPKVSSVTTGNTGNLEVFAVGLDGTLYHNWCDSHGWNSWQLDFMGAPKVSSVTTGNTGNLEVFVVGLDGTLYHNWCSSGGWNSWQPNFNNVPKVSKVVTGNTGNLEVFAIGTNSILYHFWCSSDGWQPGRLTTLGNNSL